MLVQSAGLNDRILHPHECTSLHDPGQPYNVACQVGPLRDTEHSLEQSINAGFPAICILMHQSPIVADCGDSEQGGFVQNRVTAHYARGMHMRLPAYAPQTI